MVALHRDVSQPTLELGLYRISTKEEMEATFDLPMDSPDWRPDSPETLRPLTPTGSLGDSDPDLLMGSKPTPPAAEGVERPHTPGRGVAGEDSADELLSLPLTGVLASHPLLSPSSELHTLYPAYQDRPKTPGREEGRWWGLPHISATVPATPGRTASPLEGGMTMMFSPLLSSPLPLLSMCSHPYVRTPRTPGRDIILRHGPPANRRRRRRRRMEVSGGQPSGGSSTPHHFLPDSSAETLLRSKQSRVPLEATSRPLQGLENMPGLLHQDGQRGPFKESGEQWRWQRARRKRRRRWVRQWRRQRSSISSPFWLPPWSRSQCEETEILHSVLRDGLDEEDSRLLLLSHQRLLLRDNGLGWLSDTLWVPHPHILL
ncbi:Histone-lysine N-methyltransferase SETD1B [Merluccius polli]|uniref:Histone-lysine N-methyltransferase SETD1B n=1 Tax=Merluccius polli TaxID=89951 RepID=A0AA47P617_MERPO|nr:Histone-lysine N-methyltransferase SETD1B [Merluccius polli]